jgi:hypothetical protein
MYVASTVYNVKLLKLFLRNSGHFHFQELVRNIETINENKIEK